MAMGWEAGSSEAGEKFLRGMGGQPHGMPHIPTPNSGCGMGTVLGPHRSQKPLLQDNLLQGSMLTVCKATHLCKMRLSRRHGGFTFKLLMYSGRIGTIQAAMRMPA